jgi:hypothetical protein
MALTYTVGDTGVETALFKVGGVLTDPTTVTATVVSPSGVSSNPTPAHPSVGTYTVSADLTEAGDWFGRIVGTGAAKGAKEWYWTVRRSEVPGLNLIAEALITVTDMRFFLDRVGQTVDMDETRWLEDLINTYSLACARYCDRQFTPERTGPGTRWPLKSDAIATGTAKKFRYDGNGVLDMSPFEIRTVTAVVMETDLPTAQQTTLVAGSGSVESDYRFEPPAKSTEGTYLWAVLPRRSYLALGFSQRTNYVDGDPLPPSSGYVSGQVGREVTVTGDWGAPPGFVPLDVQHACKIAVGQAFRNPEGYASRTGPGETIDEIEPPTGPGALPPESLKLLERYRRR